MKQDDNSLRNITKHWHYFDMAVRTSWMYGKILNELNINTLSSLSTIIVNHINILFLIFILIPKKYNGADHTQMKT